MLKGILDSNIKIVTSGLVLHLDASQLRSYPGTGTTWTDLTGNGNNLTLTNSPTWNGSGYFSTGATGYFIGNGTSTIPTGNSSYTMMVWARLFTTWGARRGFIRIGAGGGANNFNGFRTGDSPGLAFMINWWGGNDLYVGNNNANLSVGTWCMVTAQFDGTTRRIWGNTTNVGSDTPTGKNTIGTQFSVGVTVVGDDYFNGDIAAAYIYNRALSSTEITQNFNANKVRFGL